MTINSGNDANAGSGDTPTKTTLQVTMSTDAGLQIVTTTTPVTAPTLNIVEQSLDSSQPVLQKISTTPPPVEPLSKKSQQLNNHLNNHNNNNNNHHQHSHSNHHHHHRPLIHHHPVQQQQNHHDTHHQHIMPMKPLKKANSLRMLPELIAVPITPPPPPQQQQPALPPKTPTSVNCKVVGFNDNTEQFALPVVDNCVETSSSLLPLTDDWKAALVRDISEYGRQFDREIARHSSSCTSASSSRPESRTSGGQASGNVSSSNGGNASGTGGQLSRASTSASSHSQSSTSGNARSMRKSPTQCSSGGDSAEERGRRSVSPPIRELLTKPKIRPRNQSGGMSIVPAPVSRPRQTQYTCNMISIVNDTTPVVKKPTMTAFEKIRFAMQYDRRWLQDMGYGRRIGMYRFRGDVGNGNFSTVKFATHSLIKEKVAIKILDKSKLDPKTQKMLVREIRTMETLHHQHLVRIFEVMETWAKHYLVMELAPGGELYQVISQQGRFGETEAKFYFAQIVSAIDHMHQHNLIHRDIKAENVFFSDPYTIKVGDFGFSTRVTNHDDLLSTFCGSPPYAAPELFRDESYRGPYVDFWAMGVLLYFMVTGKMPFRAQTIVSLKRLILECRYEIPTYVSFECCQLIAGFLQKDPPKRYSLDQARATRWLRSQVQARSAPKYDLKTAFTKLMQERNIKAQLKRHNSVGELLFNSENSAENGAHNAAAVDGVDSVANQKRNNRMSLIETKSSSSSSANDSKLIASAGESPIKPTKKQLLSDAERKTFRQLQFLGIDSNIIAENLDRGSLSAIAGTFRILMHRNLQESARNSSKSTEKPVTKPLDRTKSLPDDNQLFDKYVQKTEQTDTKKETKPKPRLPFIVKNKGPETKESPTPPATTAPPLALIRQISQESAKRKSSTLTPSSGTPQFQIPEPVKGKIRKDSVKSDRKNSGTSLSRSWKTMNNLSVVNSNPAPSEAESPSPDSNNNQVCIQIEQQATAATPVVEPRQIVHETATGHIAPTVNHSGCSAGFGWPSSIAKQLKRSQTTPNVSTCHKSNNSGRLTLPADDGKNRCTIF